MNCCFHGEKVLAKVNGISCGAYNEWIQEFIKDENRRIKMETKKYDDMSRDELLKEIKGISEYIEGLEKELKENLNKIQEKDKELKDLRVAFVIESVSNVVNAARGSGNNFTINEILLMSRAYVNSIMEAFQDEKYYAKACKKVEAAVYSSEETERVKYEYVKNSFDNKLRYYSEELKNIKMGGEYNKELEKFLNLII